MGMNQDFQRISKGEAGLKHDWQNGLFPPQLVGIDATPLRFRLWVKVGIPDGPHLS